MTDEFKFQENATFVFRALYFIRLSQGDLETNPQRYTHKLHKTHNTCTRVESSNKAIELCCLETETKTNIK